MSRHRAILVALATLFTAGTTSAALACCEWGNPAPLAYQWSGCGGCGPAVAPVTYAEPVFAGGCSGCGGCGGGYATPPIEPTPIAPSPIYVVNQGPDYTGPGIMVPYRVYGPGAGYAPPPAYSYVTGEPYPAGYGMNPYYAGAGPVVPYRERAYYHHRYPRYAGPVGPYRPYLRYPHRPLGVRY
jgi:hypothetical protein